MYLFRNTSSSTFVMSDVWSFYIPSSIQDWSREVKIWATDRQYSFCLVDPMDKSHKDPDVIDLSVPRHAQNMHKAWKKHQNTVYWFEINLALRKEWKSYQTRSNAIILHETLPSYCVPKVVRMETGEVTCEQENASPRPPPRISLDERIGFRSCSTTGWTSCSTNPKVPNWTNQIQTQIVIERCNPFFALKKGARESSRSQEIETRSFREEAVNHDTTGKPVVGRDANHEPGHEQSMLNEVDIELTSEYMDCHILLWNKLRTLVFVNWFKKIENHPHRHALQRDPQQTEAYNPFSTTTKRMIQDVGNVELFELFETVRRSAQTGVKASSIVHSGVSWKNQWPIDVSLWKRWTFFHFQNTSSRRPHGHRYGKLPGKKEYHLAHNLRRDASKKD